MQPMVIEEQRVRLRAEGRADADFLAEVFAASRPELAVAGLDLAAMQLRAQHTAWDEAFPDLERSIVLLDHAPVGRLYVDDAPDHLRVVDILIAPVHQSRGIGTELLGRCARRARRDRRAVVLQVERSSRAASLYARLGFEETGGDVLHAEMRLAPGEPSAFS